MAEANEQVLSMIEKELTANPDSSNEDLRKKAERIDASIGGLSARQFNARYPLQVKRRMKPTRRRRAGARKPGRSAKKATRARRDGARASRAGRSGRAAPAARGGAGRDSVRGVLLDFARDVAAADGKAQIVDLIAGVDEYVDRVMKAKQG